MPSPSSGGSLRHSFQSLIARGLQPPSPDSFTLELGADWQRWLRTLDIEHHQILPGTDASMAPGFENEAALKQSKGTDDYWAKKPAPHAKEAAE